MMLWIVFAAISATAIAIIINPIAKQNIREQRQLRKNIIIAICLLTIAASILLYAVIGDPFERTMPLSKQLTQPKNISVKDFMKTRRQTIVKDSQNTFLWRKIKPFFEKKETQQAVRAYKTVISITGGNPKLLADYAEQLTDIAGGIVTDVARATFEVAAEKNPKLYKAKYFCALAEYQRGHISLAKEIWTDVAQNDSENSPWKHKAKDHLLNLER